ncbi:MAG: peptide deformylase [Bdellovibrionota bacterium]
MSAVLEILKYPDPRLAEKSENVEVFDENFHGFLDEMATTMYSANGIGLAAPQVNRLWRVFVIDIRNQDERYNRILEFINPVLSGAKEVLILKRPVSASLGFPNL